MGDFEIFSNGELEKSMEKVNTISWMELLKTEYESLVNQLMCPERQKYELKALGPDRMRIGSFMYDRKDSSILTTRSVKLHCSHWIPVGIAKPMPCLLYLHGMTESRGGNKLAALEGLRVAAMLGMSLFAYDSRAHGLSGGDFVTYGYEEKHDLDEVLRVLHQNARISHVMLWGTGLGAATALQFVDMVESDAVSGNVRSHHDV